MPWKESNKMSQRLDFVGRLFRGERMTDLCREYGISRKTGYKFKERFLNSDPDDWEFGDLSRRPHHSPFATPLEIVELVVAWREKHPTWGPRKLKCEMEKRHSSGVDIPATSTIGEILKRENLVKPRKRRRRASPSPASTRLRESSKPNQLWGVDFKGQFRLRNKRYCYPLTVTDHFSRFLLACEGLENTKGCGVRESFRVVFAEYGVPDAIRMDNGSPFASTGLAGLSKLSVWWMRLGIRLERIDPGHPEQNGRHERMHRTLKAETTRPAKPNFLQQQEHFDYFRKEFNEARPHEGLQMKYPAEVYEPSKRCIPEVLEPLDYPLHDCSKRVSSCGKITVPCCKRLIYLGAALGGEYVGLREYDDNWLVTFMELDLGYISKKTWKFMKA